MNICFHKMHGLGNDFVLLDIDQPYIELSEAGVRRLANRHTGIGFDQILRLSVAANDALRVDIVNADGSPAQQCGNGMRAIACWLQRQGRLAGECLLQTDGGTVTVGAVDGQNKFYVDLPAPEILATIPAVKTTAGSRLQNLHQVSVGNPHLVIWCDDPERQRQLDGRELAEFSSSNLTEYRIDPFAEGCNAGFGSYSGEHIQLYVWERGAGPTMACGSGACAAAWVLMQQQELSRVTVDQPGGRLVLECLTATGLRMTGEASYVYQGSIGWPDSALETSV